MSTSSLTTKAITESPWAIAIGNYIQSHPVLWFSLFALMLVGSLLKLILSAVPQIDILKSKILLPLVKKYKHKKLIKSAIKSDIRGHVNKEVAKVKKFLPCGWAEDMDIDWVDTEEASTLRNDKRIIVRIRPLENQEHNFVNASYHFLHSGFFPKMQSVIPKPHYEASVLYICRKVVDGRGKTASTIFEDNFLEPSIQKFQEIPEYMDDYELMDKRGFFMGTFLRELYAIATNAKFSRARNNIPEETTKMLAHVKNFIGAYDNHLSGEKEMAPSDWWHGGSVSKYAILLVARPESTRIDPYIKRAQDRFNAGSKRLYVFGANHERKFANAVIAGIDGTINGAKLVESFETPYDYRGMPGGIGAVFEYNRSIAS